MAGAMTKTPCLNNSDFETRVQSDGRELHRCTNCLRVARTKRNHRQPDRNTASHDKTMAILFDHARPIEEAHA